MSVLHLNIASFPIQVESLASPRLVGRPVVVAASTAPRAPILSVSPEAYALGIRKGMSRKKAQAYDRRLVCLQPNPALYQKAQKKLLQIVSKYTPVYEPIRLGSVYLDMEGMELLLGKPVHVASQLRAELLRQLHLDPAFGVARNKLVSRIAAKVMRPQGLCEIFPGNEEEFLHPLAVELLPGIGRVTQGKLLRELGVRRIGDLARVPPVLLTQLFGKVGLELHQKSQGLDASAVETAQRLPSLSGQEVFPEPSNDDEFLLSRLWSLVSRLGFTLRARRQMAGRGTLIGTYVDRERTEFRFSVQPPSHSDFILFQCCEVRWKKFLSRRTSLKSLSLILSRLQPEFIQLDFTHPGRKEALLVALDALKSKYGDSVIRLGRLS